MDPGQITVVAIGCGIGALLVGSVGTSSSFLFLSSFLSSYTSSFFSSSKSQISSSVALCIGKERNNSLLTHSYSLLFSTTTTTTTILIRYWRRRHDPISASRRSGSEIGHRVLIRRVHTNRVRASVPFAQIHEVRAVEMWSHRRVRERVRDLSYLARFYWTRLLEAC